MGNNDIQRDQYETGSACCKCNTHTGLGNEKGEITLGLEERLHARSGLLTGSQKIASVSKNKNLDFRRLV